jgi:hypothetical protein
VLSVCSFSVGIAIRRGKGSVFSVVEGISGVGGVSTIGVGGFDVVEGEFDTVIGLIGSLLTRFVVEATKKSKYIECLSYDKIFLRRRVDEFLELGRGRK